MANKKCKLWRGCLNSHGYGQVKWAGKQIGAHVLAWQQAHGRLVPKGKCVLHHCDVRCCIEPTHLWLGTKGDNNRDRAAKGRNGGLRKITKSQVNAIRRLRPDNSLGNIAKMFSVTRQRIWQLCQ